MELIMARNEARRQKQLAKKKAKRQEKRAHLARLTSPDPTVQLADVGSWPVEEALVPENLWTQGIGQLVMARRHPNGRLVCGIYLVDTYCLGVKNAYWRIVSRSDYQQLLYDIGKVGRHERVTPEYFAKLVHDAAAYAQAFGFAPHPDYRQARLVLTGIDTSLCPDTFTFGKDGKPFYVRGPRESLSEARLIAERVTRAGGHYIIPMEESIDALAIDDAHDELEVD
jgi:hypothetical protein